LWIPCCSFLSILAHLWRVIRVAAPLAKEDPQQSKPGNPTKENPASCFRWAFFVLSFTENSGERTHIRGRYQGFSIKEGCCERAFTCSLLNLRTFRRFAPELIPLRATRTHSPDLQLPAWVCGRRSCRRCAGRRQI
jgi:hypothetical protein